MEEKEALWRIIAEQFTMKWKGFVSFIVLKNH